MNRDEKYMHRCIELARLGTGRVEPNPLVGAVIVSDDRIIGEGYHEEFGKAHAEVNAINSVKDKGLLKDSTIYVSLEPCTHFGKTAPCADLLVQNGFKRVVVGTTDPNPEVNGKGGDRIRRAGIDLTIGVLENDCTFINRKFLTFHEKGRPYILLKWAQSMDGFIDQRGKQVMISAPEIQPMVHQWRREYDAILVGRKTVETDDPQLTVRLVAGKNPLRIVIDPELKLPQSAKVFDQTTPTLVFNSVVNRNEPNLNLKQLSDLSPSAVLSALYEMNIQSAMIEGGSDTIGRFIEAGLWDEAKVITGSEKLEEGTKAPAIGAVPSESLTLFGNRIDTYFNS